MRSVAQAANSRPQDHTDVWMMRSTTLLNSCTWRALCHDAGHSGGLKPVVAICQPEEEEIGRALSEGISAVVLVDDSPWHLAAAVHSAFERRLFVSSAILTRYQQQLIDLINSPACRQLEALTEREHDVLVCMAHGYSNSGIAKKLHITRATVGSHVLRILRKLNASNRTEAAAVAHQVGLVGSGPIVERDSGPALRGPALKPGAPLNGVAR
ncbi:MAG: hypothetical protein GEU98_19165 [Pseudonocardiaceae bacterium]|nr:hypothetical protein [Pseudonocardiaceae bacterium]